MDELPEEEIRRELRPSEKLLWAGRPRQGLMLQPSDALMIPFSLVWGGFAMFWEALAVASRAPFFFKLWGIPFVLIGLYMIAGRFWVDAWRRAATVYGITSERALFVTGSWSRTVRSLNLDTLGDVRFSERSRGGTITFGVARDFYRFGRRAAESIAPSFRLDDDARRVYEILVDAQQRARSSR